MTRDGQFRSRDGDTKDVNVRRVDDDVWAEVDRRIAVAGRGLVRREAGVVERWLLGDDAQQGRQGWNLFTSLEQAIDGPTVYSSDDPDGTFRPTLPRRWFAVPSGSLLTFVWRGAWEDATAMRLLRREGFDGTVETADEFPLRGLRAVVPSSRPYQGGFQFATELVGTGNHICDLRPIITALGTSGQTMPVPDDPVDPVEAVGVTNCLAKAATANESVSNPGTSEGDLVVAGVWQSGDTAVALPSGFTTVESLNSASPSGAVRLGYKVATDSEPASYSFDTISSRRRYKFISVFRNVDTSDPVVASDSGFDAGSTLAFSLDAVDDGVAVCFGAVTRRHEPFSFSGAAKTCEDGETDGGDASGAAGNGATSAGSHDVSVSRSGTDESMFGAALTLRPA